MSQSRIVITGTIASGKSTLSKLLRNYGYFVIDSDKVNSDLLKKGEKNYNDILKSKEFNDVFENGEINKKKLASIIFNDEEKRRILNNITHKNIIDKIDEIISESDDKVIFIEIPLFFQLDLEIKYDYVWLVKAKRDVQIKRLIERDNIDLEYAQKKLESTSFAKYMQDNSDEIFDNSDDIDNLKTQLDIALDKWSLK
ncbi:MAG: dephospho-CoA kinase [Tissierellia bacterium]|nr:dephospho-CoA kinase [Tissierellia bacterium]